MIDLDNARNLLLKSIKDHNLKYETCDLNIALNRTVSSDIIANSNLPSFNCCAMDGFACRRSDLKSELTIIEKVIAGTSPIKKINKNECSSIMTGAELPRGSDCVFIVEESKYLSDNAVIFTGKNTKNNIKHIGDLVKEGDLLLSKGTVLTPQHLALLATFGITDLDIYISPRISVMATGSELVEPNLTPSHSQIRNSNSIQTISQIKKLGLHANYLGIIPDKIEILEQAVSKSISNNDVTILSGGVSMGEYDMTATVIKNLSHTTLFEKIAIKPGMPNIIGVTNNNRYIIGLPGNPVASFVVFELLIKPFLLTLCGGEYTTPKIALPLNEKIDNNKSNRAKVVPIVIDNNRVTSLKYKGSADLTSICEADGLIIIPSYQCYNIDQQVKIYPLL